MYVNVKRSMRALKSTSLKRLITQVLTSAHVYSLKPGTLIRRQQLRRTPTRHELKWPWDQWDELTLLVGLSTSRAQKSTNAHKCQNVT